MDKYYGEILVQIARKVIEVHVRERKTYKPKGYPNEFNQKRGVFVSIHLYPGKELRGCIGYPEPVFPLIEALVSAAVSATMDPRFPHLEEKELASIVVEVSVLTLPQLIEVSKPEEYLDKISLGRDGLIIEKGPCRGLLLPQVPVEWNWNKETFLGNLCIKASLSQDQWMTKGVKIYKFQSEIFAEEFPMGSVRKTGAGKP